MKRFALILTFSIVISIASAQESKVVVGIELAGIRTLPWEVGFFEKSNPLYSISPGINLEYLLSQSFTLKTGAIFERKGFYDDFSFTDIQGTLIDTRTQFAYFDYLTLPFLVSYSTGGQLKFYINSGTYFSFLLSNTTTFSASTTRPEEAFDVSDDTKKIDFGLSFGCGIVISTGSRVAIDIGLRDNLGLIHIFKQETEGKAHFNTIGLVAGLKYRL